MRPLPWQLKPHSLSPAPSTSPSVELPGPWRGCQTGPTSNVHETKSMCPKPLSPTIAAREVGTPDHDETPFTRGRDTDRETSSTRKENLSAVLGRYVCIPGLGGPRRSGMRTATTLPGDTYLGTQLGKGGQGPCVCTYNTYILAHFTRKRCPLRSLDAFAASARGFVRGQTDDGTVEGDSRSAWRPPPAQPFEKLRLWMCEEAEMRKPRTVIRYSFVYSCDDA